MKIRKRGNGERRRISSKTIHYHSFIMKIITLILPLIYSYSINSFIHKKFIQKSEGNWSSQVKLNWTHKFTTTNVLFYSYFLILFRFTS